MNPQCVRCNEMFHGQPKKYRAAMVLKYNEKKVQAWEQEAKKPIHDRDMDYEVIKIKYREKLHLLLIPFGYNTYQEMLQGHQY